MTFHLGLTGSIAMGKSTTAGLFRDRGCVIWDADECVARLYGRNGKAVAPIRDAFPGVIMGGKVDRTKLRATLQVDTENFQILEDIVHPLVQRDRSEFRKSVESAIAVYDIPLLFETNSQDEFDAVCCVYTSQKEQRARLEKRGTMTTEQVQCIIKRQMPSSQKKSRTDFIICTNTMDQAISGVNDVLEQIAKKVSHA